MSKPDISKLGAMFNRSLPVLFVDRECTIGSSGTKSFDLILSPSLYWVRREKLPIKRAYEAKKLLPSIFDEILPEGSYSYKAIKEEDNQYLIFAYSDELIIDIIESHGLKASGIRNLYFAQLELPAKKPLAICEGSVLVNSEGIITKMPAHFIEDSIPLGQVLGKTTLSKHTFALNRYKNLIIDTRTTQIMIVALLLFIIASTITFYKDSKALGALMGKQAQIRQSHNLPATSIQLRAIKSNLTGTHKEELEKREVFGALFKLPLQKSEYFVDVRFSSTRLSFAVILNTPQRAEALKGYLAENFSIESINVTDNAMNVEASL